MMPKAPKVFGWLITQEPLTPSTKPTKTTVVKNAPRNEITLIAKMSPRSRNRHRHFPYCDTI